MTDTLIEMVIFYALLAGVFLAAVGAVGWCASALMGHPSDRVAKAFEVMFWVGIVQTCPLTIGVEYAVLAVAALALAVFMVAIPFALVGWVIKLCYLAVARKPKEASK